MNKYIFRKTFIFEIYYLYIIIYYIFNPFNHSCPIVFRNYELYTLPIGKMYKTVNYNT